MVNQHAKIKLRKDGSRALRWSNRHFAWNFALESVNSNRSNYVPSDMKAVWTGLMAKWQNVCKSWDAGIFRQPRFKKFNDSCAIQKQLQKNPSQFEFVDLSWCGSPALADVPVIYHRTIPKGAQVKQVALIKEVDKWFVCFFLEGDKKLFERQFAQTGKAVGIDPGLKSALTTSDGDIIQPKALSKDNRLEKKLRRLQRQLDRQTRACNPDSFNEDGTFKRGKIITLRSHGMLETVTKIAEIKKHFKDAKADYYHNQAIRLLNQYDIVGVGNAKLHCLVRGQGKAKRAQNTRVREHAISDFVSKLKDKASLSITPKQVVSVPEAYTSKTCNVCGEVVTLTLLDRQWICPKCNTSHDRDVNAAINIKKKALAEIISQQTAGAQLVSKVRRLTKGKLIPKGKCPRSTETISSQDGGMKSGTFVSVQVNAQDNPVTIEDTKVDAIVDSASPTEMLGLSQSQSGATVTR